MNAQNLSGYTYLPGGSKQFSVKNPATGQVLDGTFTVASRQDIDQAVQLAARAFQAYRHVGKEQKALFLRAIAEELDRVADQLGSRAVAESALPPARINNELGRTTGQLRLFASLVEEGSWVEAVIDTALPERQPPRPDIRRMLVPLGPVVVFGASNFPLAFSVAGGDTASALAAGCPVIVKAHPAHPGTSAIVAGAIKAAAQKHDLPDGVFSILYDDGFEVGAALVQHPRIKAVTFTGSFKGGMALLNLAAGRGEPIPVFAEMGSINPVVFLPEAIKNQGEELAKNYAASITLGAGQFCTNPGLLLAIQSDELDAFKEHLAKCIQATLPATMLTEGIYHHFEEKLTSALHTPGVTLLSRSLSAEGAGLNQPVPVITQVSAYDFLKNPALLEEVFGPYSLLVVADDVQQLQDIIQKIPGQLTATVMAEPDELPLYKMVVDQLADRAGRIILNGVPTGVEVCAAMQHGGPFPATTDSRFTSVGSSAIKRFARPLAWQNWENSLLPDELKAENPCGIWRMMNNEFGKK